MPLQSNLLCTVGQAEDGLLYRSRYASSQSVGNRRRLSGDAVAHPPAPASRSGAARPRLASSTAGTPAGNLAVCQRQRRLYFRFGIPDTAGKTLAVLEYFGRRVEHAHVNRGRRLLLRHKVLLATDIDLVFDVSAGQSLF